MKWMRRREELPASADGNVVELRAYQQKAARQRRLAWWAALVFGVGPENKPQAKQIPAVSPGEISGWPLVTASQRGRSPHDAPKAGGNAG